MGWDVLIDTVDEGDTITDDIDAADFIPQPKFKVGIYDDLESYPYILKAGDIEIQNAVIKTDTFVGGGPPYYGFSRVRLSSQTTYEELGYVAGAVGQADVGARAAQRAGGATTTEAVGTEVSALAEDSISIGLFAVLSNTESNTAADELIRADVFFHYSNGENQNLVTLNLSEASVDGSLSDPAIILGPGGAPIGNYSSYDVGTPFNYTTWEQDALRLKFGTDVTLIGDNNVTTNALDMSVNSLIQDLLTSYSISKKMFPRTRPIKLTKKDITAIPTTEASEIGIAAAISRTTDTESTAASTTITMGSPEYGD